MVVLRAGDCKLEYDRATGCYLDHTQIAASNSSSHLFSSFAQPSAELDRPFLPPPEPTYDEVLQSNAVNGGSAPQVAPASPAALDRVFLNKAADQKMPERNHVAQHVGVPEGLPPTKEVEYDDTDVKSGDQIQQFRKGQAVQVMGVH